mmetsp:Transcript_20176/g.50934  ORF Transcript_20176/g.50934 Transcript_20176/m.50934 type:complete len:455 (-) Transcript_20176:781-2145(-)
MLDEEPRDARFPSTPSPELDTWSAPARFLPSSPPSAPPSTHAAAGSSIGFGGSTGPRAFLAPTVATYYPMAQGSTPPPCWCGLVVMAVPWSSCRCSDDGGNTAGTHPATVYAKHDDAQPAYLNPEREFVGHRAQHTNQQSPAKQSGRYHNHLLLSECLSVGAASTRFATSGLPSPTTSSCGTSTSSRAPESAHGTTSDLHDSPRPGLELDESGPTHEEAAPTNKTSGWRSFYNHASGSERESFGRAAAREFCWQKRAAAANWMPSSSTRPSSLVLEGAKQRMAFSFNAVVILLDATGERLVERLAAEIREGRRSPVSGVLWQEGPADERGGGWRRPHQEDDLRIRVTPYWFTEEQKIAATASDISLHSSGDFARTLVETRQPGLFPREEHEKQQHRRSAGFELLRVRGIHHKGLQKQLQGTAAERRWPLPLRYTLQLVDRRGNEYEHPSCGEIY